jgi:polyphosphate kinase
MRILREDERSLAGDRVAVPRDEPLFLNRELSWLAFNERVLEQACNLATPLFERLKFLVIAASNLDEFFMVRVAGLKQQVAGGVAELSADAMLPGEQLAAVGERAHRHVVALQAAWRDRLLPELATAGIRIAAPRDFTPEQRSAARQHFRLRVFPALTPLAVDPGHPFPHLGNKSLNVAAVLSREGTGRRRKAEDLLAVVQVPSMLPRLVPLPAAEGRCFAFLEEIIGEDASELFPGYVVRGSTPFRVTRNWDLAIDEEESEDLLSTIKEELHRRDRGAAVRLEIPAGAPPRLVSWIAGALRLEEGDVYRIDGPLQLSDLATIADADPRPDLRAESFQPATQPALADGILAAVKERDRLLHHPYDSFDPVVRFVEEAADDPDVLAIKQTLYRTSGDSPFVRALSRAAENGKQVTVLVEIKARFDEANNIAWARHLEESGVHVVYGVIGLKTHCKIALVVRRERDGIRRLVHVGTGNYNPQTARQYTDLSLFTAREEVAEDVAALFNLLTGYAEPPKWRRLAVAPFDLQERLLGLVRREGERARAGRPARIVAKMNALVDPVMIRALYDASAAGVEIDLLVRGICCLRPGLPGRSERIRVRSVVDRFLEHARIFLFGTGDDAECWISSADWMPRNFHRRVEVMVQVDDLTLRARIDEEILGGELRDGSKAWRLGPDGRYEPEASGKLGCQTAFMSEAARRSGDGSPRLPAIRPLPSPPAEGR